MVARASCATSATPADSFRAVLGAAISSSARCRAERDLVESRQCCRPRNLGGLPKYAARPPLHYTLEIRNNPIKVLDAARGASQAVRVVMSRRCILMSDLQWIGSLIDYAMLSECAP